MLKGVLLAISIGMTAGIYIPLWRRILRRKATRDYSKTSQMFITACQVQGFVLATAEHAHYLQVYYVVQILLCLTQLGFIYYFWNTVPPILRESTTKMPTEGKR